MPSLPLAHEKWFVDDPGAFDADWAFALETASLLLIGAVVLVALAWHVVGGRLPRPELPFLEPLGRLAPWIPRLLGIHLGVSLLSLAVQDAYLAPNLSLDDVPGGAAIAFAEGLLGVWFITGAWLRPAGLVTLLLGPLAALLAGPVAMLEAIDLLGIALFLVVLPPGRDRYGAVSPPLETAALAIFALRVCAGLALVVLAFSEKFANPALAREFIGNYPAFDLFDLVGIPLSDDAFIRMAGAIELLFGLLLISGRIPQVAVIVAGIPFNATLFFLGRTELIGHLPVYGVMLALLVYGSSRTYADVVPAWPWPSAPGLSDRARGPGLARQTSPWRGCSISAATAVGQLRPEVALDQPQGHVDAGGDPAGGDQVAVVDHPGLDHLGARGPEVLDGAVVGDGRAAPGQAGGGGQHGPGADGGHHGPGPVGGGDRRRQLAPLGLGPGPLGAAVVPAAAGDHQQVGPGPGRDGRRAGPPGRGSR